jgi:pyrimidine-nucleoside phosphorylase
VTSFDMIELIERKRDGGALGDAELHWIIAEYTAERIPDYQMAALLMAVFLKGFNERELAAWTDAMLHSGEILSFPDVTARKVDKHSTGGVGDKVSIALAPMVAACGVAVPMISGRGLGHTGGTLDKLESIPGFRVQLGPDEFEDILTDHGMVLAGQSHAIAPADRLIYALRDATGTVPSIPLIASSIMSKKLAEGIDALVLDVKVGSGAFMKHEAAARRLAETMIRIGKSRDTTVVALLTDMNQPLGREVGNANEIAESIEVLRGGGPADLVEVTMALAAEMLLLGGVASDRSEAKAKLRDAIDSGTAAERFRDVVRSHGGDPGVVADPGLLAAPDHVHEVVAPATGYVTRCDALDIGAAGVRLGAGRARKEDPVDPAVGITLLAKYGDQVEEGDPLARVGYNDPDRLERALPLLERAWEIGDEAPQRRPLIIGEVR